MFGLETKLIAALALAAAALGWLGWHDHKIRQQCEQDHKLAADAEYKENSNELSRISSKAQVRREALAADAARARAAADRLRVAVGPGLKFSAAAASASDALRDAELLQAELLRQRSILAGRLADLAGFADRRDSEAEACGASYQAVRR